MNKWFFINVIFLMFTWIKILIFYHGIHTIIGGTALSLILYNWTRHAVFSTIRYSYVSSKRKIRLATLSKCILPVHKCTDILTLFNYVILIVFLLQSHRLI